MPVNPLCAQCFLKSRKISWTFFYQILNFKLLSKLVAWELDNDLGTIGKLFQKSFKKPSIYATLNQRVRSYSQKCWGWYFDLFETPNGVLRGLRVKERSENYFRWLKLFLASSKHHFQSFWAVWSQLEKNWICR